MRPPETPVEEKDVPVGLLGRASAAIGAVLLACVLVMHGLHYLLHRPAREPAWPKRRPPEPRLSADPYADLRELRKRETERLGSYGWIDKGRGVIHIPIERAMEITAK